MITLIHYFDGRSQLAVLMSLAPGLMRLALPGCDDAAVFTRRSGQWFSEFNEPVEIRFNAADDLEHDYCLLLEELAASEELGPFQSASAEMLTLSVQ